MGCLYGYLGTGGGDGYGIVVVIVALCWYQSGSMDSMSGIPLPRGHTLKPGFL